MADSRHFLDFLAPDGKPPLVPPDRGVFLRIVDDDERLHALLALLRERPEERVNPPEDLLADLTEELRIHAQVMERVVYPVLARIDAIRDAVAEARSLQGSVTGAVQDLHQVAPDSAPWQHGLDTLASTLTALIDVETRSLVPAGEHALSTPQVDELAERYDRAKAESARR